MIAARLAGTASSGRFCCSCSAGNPGNPGNRGNPGNPGNRGSSGGAGRRRRSDAPSLILAALAALVAVALVVPRAGHAAPPAAGPLPPVTVADPPPAAVPGASANTAVPGAPANGAVPGASANGAVDPYAWTAEPPSYDPAGVVDPWAALARTPGVVMFRGYVAGYGGRPGEAFASPGATADQGVFRVDGFEAGDLAAPGMPLGSTALTAQDVQVASGGSSIVTLSPGLVIDLVERRGTNEWRSSLLASGSAGPLVAGAPPVADLAPGQAGAEDVRGNRLRDSGAFGAEAGGPLRHDVLWGWGSIDGGATGLTAFGGQPIAGSDLSGAFKLDARWNAANSATLAWNHFHRDATGDGAGPERPAATTLDHADHDEIWRLADTAVVSPQLYLLATAGAGAAGAVDAPHGGLDVPIVVDAAGVAHGSWFADEDRRTTAAATFEVVRSALFGGASHEMHLAGEWRRTQDLAGQQVPAWAQIVAGSALALPGGDDALYLWRDGATRERFDRRSLWAADTVTWGRATATFGLRYDRQTPRNLASAVAEVPGDPLLPAVTFTGNDAGGVRWSSLVPRLGFAWVPAASGRVVLRASLARYASQLGVPEAGQVDPATAAAAVYYLSSTPGGVVDEPGSRFWYSAGVDPNLPPGVSPNAVDPRLHPEITDEAVGTAEYALDGDGALGLQVTWRRVSDVLEERTLVRDGTGAVRAATVGDWVPAGAVTGTLPNGAPYDVPYYDLRPGLSPTGGTLLVNGDRRQRLLAATLLWRRRLGERWSLRGHLTWQQWTWQLGPDYRRFADPSPLLGDGTYDGQPVAAAAPLGVGAGLAPPTYLDSRWTLYLSAAVRLPAGFSIAAALDGRQGFPLAYYRTVGRDQAGAVELRVSSAVDALRSDDLASLDARVDKELAWNDDWRLTLSLEALNLATAGEVLRRETDLGVSRANFVDEVVAPRLLRLGLRLELR